jgi:hypothetical protein
MCQQLVSNNIDQVALDGFSYDEGKPKQFKQENGVIREFCDNCGAFICEYGVSLSNLLP